MNTSSELYTHIEPANPANYSERTSRKITEITVHHMAGNISVQRLGETYLNPSRAGSCHYAVNGSEIGLYVSEKDIAWTNNHFESNSRAVTIETANDGGAPDWHVSDLTIETLIVLVADIAKRNNLGTLIVGKNLTMHKQYAATACPGPYLESKFQYIADRANSINSEVPETPETPESPAYTNEEFIKLLAPLAQDCQREHKLLASVTLAQAILESGYGTTELSINANNMFGIKSTNDWKGETYNLVSPEYINGQTVMVESVFRKYPTTKACIDDRVLKLTVGWAAENIYVGIVGETDVVKAVNCLSGWATAPTYVEKLLELIDRWNLTQYDITSELKPTPEVPEGIVEELNAIITNLTYEKEQLKADIVEKDRDIVSLSNTVKKIVQVLIDDGFLNI